MKRRAFCLNTAMLLSVAPWLGACLHRRDPGLLANPGRLETPLFIDAHAHCFNATDLQVDAFVSRVAPNEVDSTAIRLMLEAFGPVLQFVAWSLAPDARSELRILDGYLEALDGKSAQVTATRPAEHRQEQYRIAKAELERAGAEVAAARGISPAAIGSPEDAGRPEEQALASILQLPDRYEDLRAEPDGPLPLSGRFRELRALLRFLVEMFQYRYVSLLNYFDTYSTDGYPIDLVTPSLVDFDWWLRKGSPTRSSLPDQVLVGERLARLSGGRVHCFVPFDPLRQVAWSRGGTGGFSPIALVEEAVMSRGFVGVKLYPPMGFGVYGNGAEPGNVWTGKSWLPSLTQEPSFGGELDRALDQLYELCERRGIAIMGHSNASNMADADFRPLLDDDNWRKLYERYEVSGSFGHFSGLGRGVSEERWGRFVDLLNEDSASGRRFADASYFTDALFDSQRLSRRLRRILFDSQGGQTPVFDRLLYGTDWKMLLMEVNADAYMRRMLVILEGLETRLAAEGFGAGLRNRVLGGNAVRFLGLGAGQKARARLDAFYGEWGIETPLWMQKADRSAPG